jgi:poly-gamma-glutamate synthesis protein (capsule biosynthesis protein)
MTAPAKLEVIAVGDLMLGDGIQQIRRGVRAAWAGKDAATLLAHLQPELSGAGITIGNLECVLGAVDARDPQKMIYTGSPEHLAGLKAIGFTHLALANNHILEHGLPAAERTRQLVERAGMVACGGLSPVRSLVAGMAVDLFTYNLIHDTPHLEFYRDAVTGEDLAALRASDADVKIVNIHWGEEYARYPSPSQIELGHQLVEHGACLVLGHHPHVTQGVEKYRDGLIAYSLGNFVFDMTWSERTRSAFILKVELEPGRARGFQKIPCRLDQAFVPRLASAADENDKLDAEVLRFRGQPEAYRNYSRQNLSQSRWQAIFHLLRNFYAVDAKTWEILFGRRLKWLMAR